MLTFPRPAWLGAALDTAIVPAGVALAVGLGLAQVMEPRWITGGAPWATGYAKNVELLAGSVGALAGGAAPLLFAWRLGRRLAGILAVVGYAALAWQYPAALPVGALVLVAGAALGVGLAAACANPVREAPRAPGAVWWVVGLAAIMFLINCGPLLLDVFHHGEMLESAVDLLHGGRPFVTYQWPHGASDTGLTALWILLTGKVGSSPIKLSMATVFALAGPALYLALRRPLGGARATALACWLAVAALWVAPRVLSTALGLRTCGLLVFTAAAFAAITARPRPRALLTGVALALAFVFRIDAGVYGAVAVGAVLALRGSAAPGAWGARSVWTLRAGALVGLGAGATWLALWWGLGWPDATFFRYNLQTLPRFHSINNGLPYAWPGAAPPLESVLGAFTILLPVVLLAVAARALVQRARAGVLSGGDARLELVVFLGVFALLALHTPLSRSDLPHLVHWTYYPLLCALALCGADALARSARAHVLCGALTAAFVVALFVHPDRPLLSLVEHLRPNPPVGACAETMFTPREAAGERTARFIAATCQFERLLHEHGVGRIFVDFGAPWYYVRFGLPPVSPYYVLNRAWTPADQAIALNDLRRYDAGALLKVHGFGAIVHYDVHNMYHVPIIEAYLRARRDGAPAIQTPLGAVYFWNEPSPPLPPLTPIGADAPGPDLELSVNRVVYDPVSQFLEAVGWAADSARRVPLAALEVAQPAGIAAEVAYGEPRPDVAAYLGPHALRSGFWFVTRASPDTLQRADFGLRLVAADGRERFIGLDQVPITRLPPLDGVDSDALAVAVSDAEGLGRADRDAALARHQGLRTARGGASGVDGAGSLQ